VAWSIRAIERRLYSQEHEFAADERALELCLRAGYSGPDCLKLFDILKAYALDYGDEEAVYGVDDELDLAENPLDRLFLQARSWRLRRKSSHPPLTERHARLRALLARPGHSQGVGSTQGGGQPLAEAAGSKPRPPVQPLRPGRGTPLMQEVLETLLTVSFHNHSQPGYPPDA
jgi:hypothetical protein